MRARRKGEIRLETDPPARTGICLSLLLIICTQSHRPAPGLASVDGASRWRRSTAAFVRWLFWRHTEWKRDGEKYRMPLLRRSAACTLTLSSITSFLRRGRDQVELVRQKLSRISAATLASPSQHPLSSVEIERGSRSEISALVRDRISRLFFPGDHKQMWMLLAREVREISLRPVHLP